MVPTSSLIIFRNSNGRTSAIDFASVSGEFVELSALPAMSPPLQIYRSIKDEFLFVYMLHSLFSQDNQAQAYTKAIR